jgi:hypothetical protein
VARFRGNKGGYLVTTNGCFLGIHSKKVSSLRSVQRLYISDPSGSAESLEFGSYQSCSGFRIELRVGVKDSSGILRVELSGFRDEPVKPVGSAGGPGPWRLKTRFAVSSMTPLVE